MIYPDLQAGRDLARHTLAANLILSKRFGINPKATDIFTPRNLNEVLGCICKCNFGECGSTVKVTEVETVRSAVLAQQTKILWRERNLNEDVIIVPAGTPHWFREVTEPLNYYVVKAR